MERRSTIGRVMLAGAMALALLAGVRRASAEPLPEMVVGGGRGGLAACTWPFIVTAQTMNLAYPDPYSTYWAMPVALAPDERLLLRGTYPSARFMAVTLYDFGGDILDQLSDFQIAPDPGSANPYAEADPPPGSGRRFSVEVVPAGAQAASGNAIQLEPGETVGWLVYRIYLGNGDPQGGVALPSAELVRGGRVVRRASPCARNLPGTAIGTILSRAMPDPVLVTQPPGMVRIASDGGLFVNAANAYLTAFADAEPGKILVIRGKLPTTPDTGAGQSVVGDFDLRYLSITSNLNQKPYPVVDGVYDAELPLDAAGYYTVVVAQQGDAPANAQVVLQWGDGASEAVIVRNMLPAQSFPRAVQDVTPSSYGEPSDAAAVMIEFYPAIVECAKALFEAAGAPGCFAAAGQPYPGA